MISQRAMTNQDERELTFSEAEQLLGLHRGDNDSTFSFDTFTLFLTGNLLALQNSEGTILTESAITFHRDAGNFHLRNEKGQLKIYLTEPR